MSPLALLTPTRQVDPPVDKVRVFFYTHHPTVPLDEFPADWTKERLNNVGRESFAYITWLIENVAPERVHQLSDFVWFSQAAPEGDGWNARSGLMKRVRLLSPRTGMLGLGLMESATCENGGSFTMTPWVHMRELYVLATHKLCESFWPTFMNGEFIVSRKRVLHQPLSLWKYLKELLEAPLGHFLHKEGTTPERPHVYDSTLSDPIFGHMMERLWNPLFRCLERPTSCCSSDAPDVPCRPGDCQCLDD